MSGHRSTKNPTAAKRPPALLQAQPQREAGRGHSRRRERQREKSDWKNFQKICPNFGQSICQGIVVV